jgi:chemotaxis response regulator CheB
MSAQYPNLLIGIGVSAGGLPPLLTIIGHLSVSYQGAIFVARHRPPDALFLDCEVRHVKNLADLNHVAFFGGAPLRPFHKLFF